MRTVRPYRREEEAGRKPRQPAGLGLPHLTQADVRRLREPLFHHEIHLRREPHLLLRQQMREGLLQPRHRSGERAQRIGGEERAPFDRPCPAGPLRTHRHTPCPQHVRGLPLLARPPVGGWFRGCSLLPPPPTAPTRQASTRSCRTTSVSRPNSPTATSTNSPPRGRPDILSMGGVRKTGRTRHPQQLQLPGGGRLSGGGAQRHHAGGTGRLARGDVPRRKETAGRLPQIPHGTGRGEHDGTAGDTGRLRCTGGTNSVSRPSTAMRWPSRAAGGVTILLAGRPYHTDPLVQHKISDMITDMGATVITEDIVRGDSTTGIADSHSHAVEYINRILRAARRRQAQDVHFRTDHVVRLRARRLPCSTKRAMSCKRHGKSFTLLKIDDVNNIGSLKLRVRSVIESIRFGNTAEGTARTVRHDKDASTKPNGDARCWRLSSPTTSHRSYRPLSDRRVMKSYSFPKATTNRRSMACATPTTKCAIRPPSWWET